MRVVAGELGGRRLVAPPGRGTRPTADKVRGALFSSLASLIDLEGAVVVDLFAGSGALGIEALSRGAATATFVELDRRAASVITRNLATLGLQWATPDRPRAAVRTADAVALAAAPEVAGADVVFADPPYAFDGWPRLLAHLAAGGFAGLLVAETGGPLDLPAGWDALRRKAYGSTVVTMVRPATGERS
ncbi:MAG TPA: 16S rRNA (guanine(966)-N(2))-methyltransferase RsmD [Acidimicrobiales bacterium]|nr:16S rRNA (guanine(966)-N(2))-methyltransferase RsmD [Acidimicrobiales bacterium]